LNILITNHWIYYNKQSELDPRNKIIVCLIANFICLTVVILCVVIFRDDVGTYFRFGPNDKLILISVKIDSWLKWSLCVIMICMIRGTETLVNELGSTVLAFNVYNPDKKIITDFGKIELSVYTNLMWTIGSIRSILMVMINITQFDLALISVIFSEFISIFTVQLLLKEKKFVPNKDILDAQELL
jgi:hypothetical protein